MGKISLKYVSRDPKTGYSIYRRRVPADIKERFEVNEFLKALGKTDAEVAANYGPTHQYYSHLIQLARHGVSGITPAERHAALEAGLMSWGADPHSAGRNQAERDWRQTVADRLVDDYQDPVTGEYVGVPEAEHTLASALYSGISKTCPPPTLRDAFKAYLDENAKPDPEDYKRQEQRLRRVEKAVIAVLGRDCLVAEVTRGDARTWRDRRESDGVAISTIRRELADIKAVFNFAHGELDAAGVNAFSRLKLKSSSIAARDTREALPAQVISNICEDLRKMRTPKGRSLLAIWTLLDGTGARHSEIQGLYLEDIVLDVPTPYIDIRERADRPLKTAVSARRVPLVGAALETARSLLEGSPTAPHAFPLFASTGGRDRLSAALRKAVRKHTEDPRHVPYSLRHNMEDRLRHAEVFEATRSDLLGHSRGAGLKGTYGGVAHLLKLRDAIIDAMGPKGFCRKFY